MLFISYPGDDDKWQASLNFTPAAGGIHACYYQKVNDSLQIGSCDTYFFTDIKVI